MMKDAPPSEATPETPDAAADPTTEKPASTRKRSTSKQVAAQQLERKRISDRRSQRAVRERTKQHISELQSALQALLATDVNRELKLKIQENAALMDENARLRRRLERIGQLTRFDPAEKPLQSGLLQELGGVGDAHISRTASAVPDASMNADAIDGIEPGAGTYHSSGSEPSQTPLRRPSAQSLHTNQGEDSDRPKLDALGQFHSSVQARHGRSALNEPSQEASTSFSAEQQAQMMSLDDVFAVGLDKLYPNSVSHDTPAAWTAGPISEDISLQELAELDKEEDRPTTTISSDSASLAPNPRVANQQAAIAEDSQWMWGSTEGVRFAPGFQPYFGASSPGAFYPPFGYSTQLMTQFTMPSRLARISFSPYQQSTGLFESWVQSTVETYRGVSKEKLDQLLPCVPCLSSLFMWDNCEAHLSRALSDILRTAAPAVGQFVYLGMYWCLHRILRYLLRPVAEELGHLPPNMRPTPDESTNKAVHWFYFLPWPQIRKAMKSTSDPNYEVQTAEKIVRYVQLAWPHDLSQAITFSSSEHIHERSSSAGGLYTRLLGGCSACPCGGPRLTQSFESTVAHMENWSLRRV